MQFQNFSHKMATSMNVGPNIEIVDSTPTASNCEGQLKKPICVIVLGMAGSGKTTFVQTSHGLAVFQQSRENTDISRQSLHKL